MLNFASWDWLAGFLTCVLMQLVLLLLYHVFSEIKADKAIKEAMLVLKVWRETDVKVKKAAEPITQGQFVTTQTPDSKVYIGYDPASPQGDYSGRVVWRSGDGIVRVVPQDMTLEEYLAKIELERNIAQANDNLIESMQAFGINIDDPLFADEMDIDPDEYDYPNPDDYPHA